MRPADRREVGRAGVSSPQVGEVPAAETAATRRAAIPPARAGAPATPESWPVMVPIDPPLRG